jgi:nitrogen regulatory protein P-II 1
MKFKLVMTLVNPEITDKAIETAKNAGATGDVVIPARGTGSSPSTFFGLTVEDKTDIILFVVEEHLVDPVMDSITQKCRLCDSGNGVAIVLNIERVAGFEKQMNIIKDRLKNSSPDLSS